MLQALLHKARQVGHPHSSGHFTLALEQARRKLARYQSEDPHFPLLKLVQAAVAGGARQVRLVYRAERLTMRAPGAVLALDRLVESQVVAGDCAEAHLAAALLSHPGPAACAQGGRLLIVGADGRGCTDCPLSDAFEASLRQVVMRPRRTALHARLGYSPVPIYFNGRCLTYQKRRRSARLPGDEVGCGEPHVLGRAFLQLSDPGQPSQVALVKHGVTLKNTPWLSTPGAICAISAQGLPLDASTLMAVEGPELLARIHELNGEVRSFYEQLLPELERPVVGPTERQLWIFLAVLLVVVAGLVALVGAKGLAGGFSVRFGWGFGERPAEPELAEQLRAILGPGWTSRAA